MAKLSERVVEENKCECPPKPLEGALNNLYDPFKNYITTNDINKTTGDKIMNEVRTLNLTLVDNNPNLKGEDKIVYQSLSFITEHSDDQTIQQILMTGKVKEALDAHNKKRVVVVDKEIQRNTGRAVKLEEVEIFDLNWQVVRVA